MQPYPPRMRVDCNELVRDRIAEIIGSRGDRAVTRVLDEASYRAALLAKLVEEAQEASGARAEELPVELADVLEALQALAKALGMSWEQLLALAAEKRARRGGFEGRIFLEYAEQAGPVLAAVLAGQGGSGGGAGTASLAGRLHRLRSRRLCACTAPRSRHLQRALPGLAGVVKTLADEHGPSRIRSTGCRTSGSPPTGSASWTPSEATPMKYGPACPRTSHCAGTANPQNSARPPHSCSPPPRPISPAR
jgi:predicted house-cleaning noncanonical NTP pyrophosphatase (MazG superfamily)